MFKVWKNRKKWLAISTLATSGALVLGGSSIPVVKASPYPLHKMEIEMNGKYVVDPLGIQAKDPNSGDYTTYMPIWYVMYAIQKWDVTSQWNGSDWNMELPTSFQKYYKLNHSVDNSGNQPVHVYVDDTLVENTPGIVSVDPYSGKDTTYVPIWYVGKVLESFGIQCTWNGVV
ncbi:hypothetical protein [Alicyclobacillus tolerans]|uniref:Copper amine oxidase-like N-terminal domain-containing protein n=1 Tax=Alicyclobacillus tolerans TaxID=90970 RepID=A0ABT9LXH8_9BACL|nr:hypothetical protein [Alicyclobacillus tengchongensis]MDP9728944.1 hypothetical protein [Alicyclobacillus tengchongensis]